MFRNSLKKISGYFGDQFFAQIDVFIDHFDVFSLFREAIFRRPPKHGNKYFSACCVAKHVVSTAYNQFKLHMSLYKFYSAFYTSRGNCLAQQL